MTAGQRVIARPSFQGRTAALLLASTFAIGVVTGLVAPLVRLIPATATATVTADQATAAWLSYRADERALPVTASQVGDPAWRTYRQDERLDIRSTGSAVSSTGSWQLYRQGERQSLGVPAPGPSTDAWRTYRAGERGDSTP